MLLDFERVIISLCCWILNNSSLSVLLDFERASDGVAEVFLLANEQEDEEEEQEDTEEEGGGDWWETREERGGCGDTR